MPDFYAVVVQKDWIEPVQPYLEGLMTTDTNKGIARQCLEEFNQIKSTMEVMKTDWAQGSFSTQQMNLIKSIATYLEMDGAQRRFTI